MARIRSKRRSLSNICAQLRIELFRLAQNWICYWVCDGIAVEMKLINGMKMFTKLQRIALLTTAITGGTFLTANAQIDVPAERELDLMMVSHGHLERANIPNQWSHSFEYSRRSNLTAILRRFFDAVYARTWFRRV